MKTHLYIQLFIAFIVISLGAEAETTISISKQNSTAPSNVCDKSTYTYTTTITGWNSNYEVAWEPTNGTITSQSTSSATVKWEADSETDGYIGKIKAQIRNTNTQAVVATSNEIEVTIKSIKHLKPYLTPYNPGTEIRISPCGSGTVNLETTRLAVPGTGDMNPDKVNDYEWTIPKGWEMNGQKSDGSKPIRGDYYSAISYPASAQGGTIKVRGYRMDCNANMQYSIYSDAVTIVRDIDWKLTANKKYFVCGSTEPITFTIKPNSTTPTIPCAVYYWNNGTTATTSNVFSVNPGASDLIVTVKVVYGGTEKTISLSVPLKAFDEENLPIISGPSTICNTENYGLTFLPNGARVSWNESSNLAEGPAGTFTAIGSGEGWVQAILTNDCGSITLSKKYLSVGWPSKSEFHLVMINTTTGEYVSGFTNNLSSILRQGNLIGFNHFIFYCGLFRKKTISN